MFGICLVYILFSFSHQRGWDSYMVYLFDKSKTVYDGPFASRSLSDCVNYIGKYAGGQLGSENTPSRVL